MAILNQVRESETNRHGTRAQNLMNQEKRKKKSDKQYGSDYGQRSSFKVNNTKLDK